MPATPPDPVPEESPTPVAAARSAEAKADRASADPDRAARPCPLCTRSFRPKRPNQRYCCPKHRRRALRLRQQVERVFSEHKPLRRRTAAVLWRSVHAERRRQGLPPLERQAFLAARASVLEAQTQLEHWAQLLREREALAAALPKPNITARFIRLLAGEPFAIDRAATYCEIVGGGEAPLFVALGFKRG